MESSDFFAETDAAGAVDAPVHVGDDQGPDIFVLDCALVLVVAASSVAIVVGVVLEVALSSLVADGAVERVVGEQELHDSASGESGWFRIGVYLHCRGDLRAAASYWFG